MQRKIKDIAEVITGYTFRSAIEEDKSGNTYVLQAKNVKLNENIDNISDFVKVNNEKVRSAACLKLGDIVIVSRGMGAGSFRSSVYKVSIENTIASSSVLVIRLTNQSVLPDYLSQYLNSKEGQTAIAQIVSGSHFQTLLPNNLKELAIPIPSIAVQKRIIELCDNIKRQEEIRNRMTLLNNDLLNSVFLQSVL